MKKIRLTVLIDTKEGEEDLTPEQGVELAECVEAILKATHDCTGVQCGMEPEPNLGRDIEVLYDGEEEFTLKAAIRAVYQAGRISMADDIIGDHAEMRRHL